MTTPPPSASTEFPVSRRILAGVGWGLLWGGGLTAVIFPLVPTSLTLGLILVTIILTSMAMGISLYWNAAREPCPGCGTVFTATPNGSRCPGCGLQVRAIDRQMFQR